MCLSGVDQCLLFEGQRLELRYDYCIRIVLGRQWRLPKDRSSYLIINKLQFGTTILLNHRQTCFRYFITPPIIICLYRITLKIMFLKLITIIATLSLTMATTYTGLFASPSTYLQMTYTTTTSNTYITFSATFTPLLSEAVLVARTTPFTPSTNPIDWQHLRSKSTTEYDYQGLITGKSQYAWILNPGIGSTIYFYLINLSTTTPAYSIVVSQSNLIAKQCTTGATFFGSTFYCQSCFAGLTGTFCTYVFSRLSQGQSLSISLSGGDYGLVTISATSNAKISVQSEAGGVFVFLQYNTRGFEEHAGVVNHMDSGVHQFTSSSQYVAILNNGENSVAVGLINTNSAPVKLTIQYVKSTGSSLMVIIIGVLGGLLLLGIIISIIYLIKRAKARRIIHPNAMNRMPHLYNRPVPSNTLSKDQISRYFPIIMLTQLFPSASMATVSNLQGESSPQHECVICLCSIEGQQQIRVGYCRHIFHDKCLSQWFEKQQNCPYCRQDYSKNGTQQLYDALRKEMGKEIKGLQIPQAIFRPRLNCTIQTLIVQDIEQQLK